LKPYPKKAFVVRREQKKGQSKTCMQKIKFYVVRPFNDRMTGYISDCIFSDSHLSTACQNCFVGSSMGNNSTGKDDSSRQKTWKIRCQLFVEFQIELDRELIKYSFLNREKVERQYEVIS